ncbi:hypothetical protein GGD64_007738 [Bradyrhizobium sp. CIR3A]|nr:hypothetical protein [Bradyrhizobium sp. CIR3A]
MLARSADRDRDIHELTDIEAVYLTRHRAIDEFTLI